MSIYERKMKMQKNFIENCKQLEYIGDITIKEVERHGTKDDLWIVLNGYVYDITKYVHAHPGGSNCFMTQNKDITKKFNAIHRFVDLKIIEKLKIGKLIK